MSGARGAVLGAEAFRRDRKGRPFMTRSGQTAAAFFAEYATTTAPEGCPVRVGDRVTVVNAYGVLIEGVTVLGFVPEGKRDAGRVYVNWDCYWVPVELARVRVGG